MAGAPTTTLRRLDRLGSMLFCLPNFVGVALFAVFPVVASFLLGFCYWRGSRLELPAIRWAGLANFRQLLGFTTPAGPLQLTIALLWPLALIAATILAARYLRPAHLSTKLAAATAVCLLGAAAVRYWLRVIQPDWNDPLFWQAFWNTLVLMTWGVSGRVLLCLAMAMLLNQRLRDILLYRTIYFLPTVSSAIALYILWQALYHPDVGVINRSFLAAQRALNALIAALGGPESALTLQPPNWLGDPTTAKPAFIFMGWWHELGGLTMLLYLAALQGIPQQLYEAADIDGASAWQKFRYVTWPGIGPTTFFILVMGVIHGFQGGFQQAYVMTRGGPAGSTTTVDYFIYNKAFFENQEMGYASAAAWVLFLVILGLTLLNWRYAQRRVHY